MIPIIYLIIVVSWILLMIGFKMKDFSLLGIASFLLMTVGIHIATNGITDGLVSVSNLATQALAIVHIGVGAYVITRGGYEIYKDKF